MPFFSATFMGVTAREMHRNDLLHALPQQRQKRSALTGRFRNILCVRGTLFFKDQVKEKVGKKVKK